MNREQLIEIISKMIEKTHNEKDKEDLLTFSDEELSAIYNELKEDFVSYNISDETRAEVLATIDELNQYLLGHVTIDAAIQASYDLTTRLLLTKYE